MSNPPKKKIKVIMAGSGALYPLYVGGLLALEEENYDIVSIAGTSGGAIASCLWSLTDIKREQETLIEKIKQTLPVNNKGVVRYSLLHFFRRWGFVKGDNLESHFENVFKERLKEASIPTYLYASNVKRNDDVVFSSTLTPELSTAKALRASCSIPFIFDPTSIGDELYVDGGWSYYLPFNAFEHEEDDVSIIGMRIVKTGSSKFQSSLIDYVQRIMYNRIVSKYKVEKIPDSIHMLDFHSSYNRMNLAKTSEEDAIQIFHEGYKQMKDFVTDAKKNS